MNNVYDLAIIGAGPAGMMAAITASQNGKSVILIEKNPQLGRKLLSTGNGRCNLTNRFVEPDRYHGASPQFIQTVIKQFDQNATMKFFEDLGLLLKEEDCGRIFPRTNQASSVVEILKQAMDGNNVEVLLDASVEAVEKKDYWRVILPGLKIIQAKKLLIATGGRAAHQLGSTGEGLGWAYKLGHSITPTYAALVPIETVEIWPKAIQGIKNEVEVWATVDSEEIGRSAGGILFTVFGLSGPAVMALAGKIAPSLKTSEVKIHIDWFPDMKEAELDKAISTVFHNNPKRTFTDALVGVLPSNMIPVIAEISAVDVTSTVKKISETERLGIAKAIKNLTLTVAKLRSLKEAQVTAGGINTEELDPQTMQSKLIDGLCFAGEIVDVDGDSGGFNLQWAWSSGHVAGMIGS